MTDGSHSVWMGWNFSTCVRAHADHIAGAKCFFMNRMRRQRNVICVQGPMCGWEIVTENQRHERFFRSRTKWLTNNRFAAELLSGTQPTCCAPVTAHVQQMMTHAHTRSSSHIASTCLRKVLSNMVMITHMHTLTTVVFYTSF